MIFFGHLMQKSPNRVIENEAYLAPLSFSEVSMFLLHFVDDLPPCCNSLYFASFQNANACVCVRFITSLSRICSVTKKLLIEKLDNLLTMNHS